MDIRKIVIPTPFYVGPVNVYLIDQEPLTLLDAGPNTPQAWDALRNGLRAAGRDVSEIRRIVISHAHADHYGLVRRVQEASGARAFIHEWDARGLLNDADYACHRDLLARAGVPSAMIGEFQKDNAEIDEVRGETLDVATLKDEEELTFQRAALRVVHTPGHTPGSVCLFRESSRRLLAADTLLKRITPNPTLHQDVVDSERRFPALAEQMCSAARIRELAPTVIHTGHGDDITDCQEHFHGAVRHLQKRQQAVMDALAERGAAGMTAWELAQRLFPNAQGIHRYLAVSESQAHLDFASAERKLTMEKKGAVEYFRNA
jgi:glyoxylase-like metal-dependent hydrolase (beta-lactamase superfamily II)